MTLFVSTGPPSGAGARRHERGRRSGQGHAPEPRVQRDDNQPGLDHRRRRHGDQPEPRSGGKSAPSGSTVTLVVAKAPTTVAVPNVVGKTTGAANAALGAAGFPATQQPQTVTNQSQNGVVLSARTRPPRPGQEGDHGDDRGRQVRRPDHADHHDHHDHADDARPGPPTTSTHAEEEEVKPARVAVLGGGRSSEHEVSLASAASVCDGLRDGRPRRRSRSRSGATASGAATGRDGGGAGPGPRGRRRRVPGAARAVRRGRDGAGPARVPRRAVRRRRRARLGAVHGQGRCSRS